MKEYAKTTLGKLRREYKNAEYSGEPCAIPVSFLEKTSNEPASTEVVIVIDGGTIGFEVHAKLNRFEMFN